MNIPCWAPKFVLDRYLLNPCKETVNLKINKLINLVNDFEMGKTFIIMKMWIMKKWFRIAITDEVRNWCKLYTTMELWSMESGHPASFVHMSLMKIMSKNNYCTLIVYDFTLGINKKIFNFYKNSLLLYLHTLQLHIKLVCRYHIVSWMDKEKLLWSSWFSIAIWSCRVIKKGWLT